MSKRIVFLGSPEFSLIPLNELYERGFEIVLVISQPDKMRSRKKFTPTPVKERAKELGLEVISPKSVNDELVIDLIKEKKPDFIVTVAFGQLLKEDFLNILPGRLINVHTSLLPKYRGAAPINRAVINGEKKTGVSIMLTEKGLDTGPILLQEETEIGPDENSEDLSIRLANMGANALIKVLEDFDYYEKNKIEQKDEEASYAKKLTKETGKIDWNKSAQEIHNQIRGVQPWPGASSLYGQDRVKIFESKAISGDPKKNIGEVISVEKDSLLVQTGQGYLEIFSWQFPGKKRVDLEDYLRGNNINMDLSFS